jgi:hypothetical protein
MLWLASNQGCSATATKHGTKRCYAKTALVHDWYTKAVKSLKIKVAPRHGFEPR